MYFHIRSILIAMAMFFVMIHGAAYNNEYVKKRSESKGDLESVKNLTVSGNFTQPNLTMTTNLTQTNITVRDGANSTGGNGAATITLATGSFMIAVLAFIASLILDGVEFHLALAETDTKLENVLATYLCPMLLKLASPHETVRKKVC
ncbi:hypothetical protein PCK2_000230 [Pneumocystis canis]|nr:hypothetical protein PCK2_000230 [Pneumocystis canis]